MLQFYWACLSFGVILALATLLFSEILGHMLDGLFDWLALDHLDFLHPMVLIGGITVIGGMGVLLSTYTPLTSVVILWLSLLTAIVLSIFLYFGYVKPMKNSENSIGFSMQDLVGKVGEVIISIPGKGYGEVLITIGASNTNQIAASFKGEDVATGTKVVVLKVDDGVVIVMPQTEFMVGGDI